MQRVPWPTAVCMGVLALLAACDSAPGPEALDRRPPLLSGFTFSPQRVSFDQLPPDQIDGDVVRIPVELGVVARGTDQPIREVAYVVQSPTSSTNPLAAGTLASAGGDRYAGTVTLEISAVDVATYPILVYAVDEAARVSGEVRGQLRYTRTFDPGSPPVIDSVEAPDTVRVPEQGAATFDFVAAVSDPDGLSNVERVEFWNADTPNNRFLMCDDGGGQPCGQADDSGDATAGDGRYTLRVFLPAGTSPGTRTFVFQATDRSGLASETVEIEVVVQ